MLVAQKHDAPRVSFSRTLRTIRRSLLLLRRLRAEALTLLIVSFLAKEVGVAHMRAPERVPTSPGSFLGSHSPAV